ncbi:MAG: hypothetical protein Ct9H300mP25_03550 [Acidobacteriota bacterium]|nr:MAG: hypothetical protein Ct9H300mP25_03550 [Acidobacteriota bacterium]
MTVGNIAEISPKTQNPKADAGLFINCAAGYVLFGWWQEPNGGFTATLVYLWVYLFMKLGAFAIFSMLRRQDVLG